MRRRTVAVLIAAALLAGPVQSGGPARAVEIVAGERLAPVPCPEAAPEGERAGCALLSVPERRDRARSGTLDVFVMVLAPREGAAAGDAGVDGAADGPAGAAPWVPDGVEGVALRCMVLSGACFPTFRPPPSFFASASARPMVAAANTAITASHSVFIVISFTSESNPGKARAPRSFSQNSPSQRSPGPFVRSEFHAFV